ncbi:hypothetical protein M002_16400 [Pseudomonas aeruginosa ID4365]|nr:hypothetical protein M002_16400 [Pseudomonas aeruginosa ID4365]
MRYSATLAKVFSLELMNFRASKGATFERMFIDPQPRSRRMFMVV